MKPVLNYTSVTGQQNPTPDSIDCIEREAFSCPNTGA